jgi:Chromate transporter
MVDFVDERPLQAGPDLGRVAWVFVRYGNFTLGGGSATAATLHRALVEKRQWLTHDQFTLCFALGRITPGTNLLAFCTGFGWVLRGTSGAITSLLAAVNPMQCNRLIDLCDLAALGKVSSGGVGGRWSIPHVDTHSVGLRGS